MTMHTLADIIPPKTSKLLLSYNDVIERKSRGTFWLMLGQNWEAVCMLNWSQQRESYEIINCTSGYEVTPNVDLMFTPINVTIKYRFHIPE